MSQFFLVSIVLLLYSSIPNPIFVGLQTRLFKLCWCKSINRGSNGLKLLINTNSEPKMWQIQIWNPRGPIKQYTIPYSRKNSLIIFIWQRVNYTIGSVMYLWVNCSFICSISCDYIVFKRYDSNRIPTLISFRFIGIRAKPFLVVMTCENAHLSLDVYIPITCRSLVYSSR